MKYQLQVDRRAFLEMQEAYDYYEGEQNGLGERFKTEIEKSLLSITTYPFRYSKIEDEIRQCIVHRFPFVIVYEVFKEVIVVYSLFHTKRNPKSKL